MPHSAAEPARLVYDSLPSAVLVLGRGGHVLHANRAAEQLLGTPLKAMRAKQPVDVWDIRAGDGARLGPGERLGLGAIDSGEPERGLVRRLCRPDGRWLEIEVDAVPALGADGRPYQAVCTITDVTERRQVEARIRQSEREWRQLFQNAGIGMARLDLRGKVLRANSLLYELLGYGPGQLEGRTLGEILLPEDAGSLSFAMLDEFDLGRVESDVRYLRHDGSPTWVHSVVSLVRDAQGRPAFLINTVEDISARKAREAELEHRVLHDVLTGLPNRVLLNDRLLQALRSARRTRSQVAVIVLDVDGFKRVNDAYGHLAGDGLLVEFGERVTGAVRRSDTVARTGGDEFAVVLSGITGAESAAGVAAKLQKALATPFRIDDEEVPVSAGIGVAVFPADGEDAESLLRSADLAMYAAKRARHGETAPAPTNRRAPLSADAVKHRIEVLESLPLLMPLTGDQIGRLARRMTEVTVGPGTVLKAAGEPAATLRVIETGTCEVLGDDAESLLVLGPGDFLGSSAILGEGPNVGVRAATECRLLELRAEVLRAVVPTDSEVFDELRRVAAQRQAAIARLRAGGAPARTPGAARTIAVYSPKGGSGKTTLALNLAAALAREHPDDVLLVDLALPYNHAALLARLSPTTSLARMAQHDAGTFPMMLRGAIVRHDAGFMVLSTALRPEEADLITADLVGRMLEVAGRLCRFVVFDLGGALSEPVLSVLERADHIIPMVTPELTSMKDASQFLEILTGVLSVPDAGIHLAVNHRSPEGSMSRADVERVLRRSVEVELGYDGARPEQAALRGEVLVLTQPRSGIARGTDQLAAGLLSAAAAAPAGQAEGQAAAAGWLGYAVS